MSVCRSCPGRQAVAVVERKRSLSRRVRVGEVGAGVAQAGGGGRQELERPTRPGVGVDGIGVATTLTRRDGVEDGRQAHRVYGRVHGASGASSASVASAYVFATAASWRHDRVAMPIVVPTRPGAIRRGQGYGQGYGQRARHAGERHNRTKHDPPSGCLHNWRGTLQENDPESKEDCMIWRVSWKGEVRHSSVRLTAPLRTE